MPNAISTPPPCPPNAGLLPLVTTPGVFNPAAVGRVRGYPRTPEAYDRQLARLRANSTSARKRGLMTRRGVPNVWAGKRDQVASLRQNADEAWRVVNVLQRNSTSPEERLDAERFALTAAYCIGLMVDGTQPTSIRLKAARVILPFLMPMP